MVIDIGGGTTDVAVISLGGVVASTSVKCAGDKLDHAIADYIKKTYNLAIGDKTAEDVKISLKKGAKGILVSSSVVLSKSPLQTLSTLAAAFTS